MEATYNPDFLFSQTSLKGGVCEVKQVRVAIAAAATGTTLITAVSNKKIRILSLEAVAITAASFFSITSFGLGDVFSAWAAYQAQAFWPLQIQGLCDSNTGYALSVDNSAASNIVLSVRYIEVTA